MISFPSTIIPMTVGSALVMRDIVVEPVRSGQAFHNRVSPAWAPFFRRPRVDMGTLHGRVRKRAVFDISCIRGGIGGGGRDDDFMTQVLPFFFRGGVF